MDTSAVSANSTAATQTKATTRGFNDLSSEDFFKLLITELQSQDPTKPMDNQQLMSELSTIRQMQQTDTMNTTLQNLATQERFGSTAAMIGHYVSGTVTNSTGASVTIQGLVVGVQFSDKNQAILELHNGNSLPASAVELVTNVENLPASVQQQLQQELAQAAGTNSASGGNANARLIARGDTSGQEVDAATAAGNQVRGVARQPNSVATALDTLSARFAGI